MATHVHTEQICPLICPLDLSADPPPPLQVDQPFDNARFNFKKVKQQEVMFAFQPSATVHHGGTGAGGSGAGGCTYVNTCIQVSPNLVLINVSPIEYGHVLLVPHVLDDLRQVRHGLDNLKGKGGGYVA